MLLSCSAFLWLCVSVRVCVSVCVSVRVLGDFAVEKLQRFFTNSLRLLCSAAVRLCVAYKRIAAYVCVSLYVCVCVSLLVVCKFVEI